MPSPTPPQVYDGPSVRSRRETRAFACACGERFAVEVWRVVDARSDGDAVAELRAGRLNRVACPVCEAPWTVHVSIVYHDADAELLVLLLPDGLRHREMEERARMCSRIAEDRLPAPRYVREFRVAFSAGELRGLLAREPEAHVDPVPLVGDSAPIPVVEAVPLVEPPSPIGEPPRVAVPVEPPPPELPLVLREEGGTVVTALPTLLDVEPPSPRRRTLPQFEPQTPVLPVAARPILDEEELTPLPEPVPALHLAASLGRDAPHDLVDDDVVAGEPIPAAALEAPDTAPLELVPALDDEPDPEATRIQREAPDARAAAVERWVANREDPAALLCGDEVILCAALPPDDWALFADGDLELRLQLHRMPDYPLLALTLVSGRDRGRAIHALLEIGRAAHRVVLDRLGASCNISLELFDEERAPIVLRTLYAPLEENVRHLFAEAKAALQAMRAAARNFDRARQSFFDPDYDRIGRAEVDLSDAKLGARELDSLQALRRAVAVTARWSEVAAERYLVEIRSVPLSGWRQLREEVVRRAIERGVHLSRALGERILVEAGVAATWSDVLRRQVAAFREASLGQRPNDLVIEEEAENWRQLIDECKAAGVAVEADIVGLAEKRRKQAKGERERAAAAHNATVADAALPASAPAATGRPRRTRSYATTHLVPVELRDLPTHDLIGLLDRPELRREAALSLCDRHDLDAMAAVFAALPSMTRTEANQVLPAIVTCFGDAAVPSLVEALASRRSYVRQGAALALGALRAPSAARPLLGLLVSEPTELWVEAARALGDLGPAAVDAVIAALRRTRDEDRDRVVIALAHLASRRGAPVAGMAAPRDTIQRLVTHADPVLRDAARRALAKADEVARADRAVRAGGHASAESVVHAFTRRFYEAIADEDVLSDDDLEEMAPEEEEEAG